MKLARQIRRVGKISTGNLNAGHSPNVVRLKFLAICTTIYRFRLSIYGKWTFEKEKKTGYGNTISVVHIIYVHIHQVTMHIFHLIYNNDNSI